MNLYKSTVKSFHIFINHAFCALIIISASVAITNAQTSGTKTPDDCGCQSVFKNLASKLETNYAAYPIAIRGKRDAEYQKLKETFKNRAAKTPPEKCILLLQEFVEFFRDGHLFVQENPTLTDADVARLTEAAEETGRKETDIRRYLDSNKKRLDPIEGIWYNRDGQRFGIMRDQKTNRRNFIAIVLSDKVERWYPGQVKAEFRKLPDGSYSSIFYSGRHFPLHLKVYSRGESGGAALRRSGLLLHMPPVTWGKAYPLKPEEENLIDSADPRRPAIRLAGNSTVVVSVPSHSPEYKPLLDSLVEKYRDQISKAENLIIDIRGDEGGGTGTTNILMPFLVTASKRSARYWVGDQTMIYSSPDNISYFKQVESQGWIPKQLTARMQANPGKLVPFSDPDSKADSDENTADVATEFPHNVAILMDGAVVSAGEAFVIQAMKNKKVTLFGENSGGVLDYQSVSIVSIPGCKEFGVNLGYPLFAASARLPKGGINATGIAPDVRINRAVKDPIRFIIDYYAQHGKR